MVSGHLLHIEFLSLNFDLPIIALYVSLLTFFSHLAMHQPVNDSTSYSDAELLSGTRFMSRLCTLNVSVIITPVKCVADIDLVGKNFTDLTSQAHLTLEWK